MWVRRTAEKTCPDLQMVERGWTELPCFTGGEVDETITISRSFAFNSIQCYKLLQDVTSSTYSLNGMLRMV